jgi:hypothetical protein
VGESTSPAQSVAACRQPLNFGGARARLAETVLAACTYERLLLVLLLLVVVLAGSLSPVQNDTWWQLRAGADMWSARHVLLTETYSHTAEGTVWPNHEWLSEIIYYAAYRVGGLPLLSLFGAALVAGGWAITWLLTRGTARDKLFMIAFVLAPASLTWAPRPQAFSLLFLMIMVGLVLRRAYIWLPLLFCLWANCHGGVLLGLVVLSAALAAALVNEPNAWKRIGLVFVGCLLAVTATPLGITFWIEIPRSLARIELYPIDEWRRSELTDFRLFPFWIAASALSVMLFRRWRTLLTGGRREPLILCAAALTVLPLAVSAMRNVGPFLMLAVPAISSIRSERKSTTRVNERQPDRPFVNLMLMSLASMAVVMTITYAYAFHISRLRWTPLPQASLQALERCPDNLYNRYDEGGYLIWFAPGHRVFLDGRQDPYPSSLILEQLRIEASGDYHSLFSRYRIHCAYLPVMSPVASRLQADGWSALYRDALWVVLTDKATIAAD